MYVDKLAEDCEDFKSLVTIIKLRFSTIDFFVNPKSSQISGFAASDFKGYIFFDKALGPGLFFC